MPGVGPFLPLKGILCKGNRSHERAGVWRASGDEAAGCRIPRLPNGLTVKEES